MATFKVEVLKVEILDHPDADALEIAQVRGYQSIVRKGQFQTGDLAAYIPEQAIVPEWVLRRLNLWDDEKGKGKLAGKQGNRVKPVKLRGVMSQGLLYPLEVIHHAFEHAFEDQTDWLLQAHDELEYTVTEGEDVTELLGITKWEPPIPTQMAGEVVNIYGKTLKYDIENIKNYPNIAQALIDLQIPVSITEKLHGTWCCIGIYPESIHEEIPYERVLITSKGLSGKGLAFKDNEVNVNNLYMRMFKTLFPDYDTFRLLKGSVSAFSGPMFFLGEIFGKGVQDLTYGLNDVQFRVFDIYEGNPSQGDYLTPFVVREFIEAMELPFHTVPSLYEGPLTWDIVREYTDGKDTVTGSHMREGIVIRTLEQEYRNADIGRVILKSVSDDYLNRKNGTEYN